MSDVVQYDQLVTFLKHASLFEIYRFSVAINNELENPARIKAVRKKFKEGDIVEYFHAESNSCIAARVLKKNPKYVAVQNCGDGKQWKIPYYLLKIDSREFVFDNKGPGLNKNNVKVGDLVGFNRDGEEIIGRVERLNQKTVSLVTPTQHRWRVAYQLLYAVIEGQNQDYLIENK